MRIGWAGVGKMGSPMVRAVLSEGHDVVVLEPLPENRASAVAAGAGVAQSVEQLAAAADIVITTVARDDVLRDLVLGAGGFARHLRPPQIFVDLSTVSPRLSAEIAGALDACAVPYLRAPVSGSTVTAGAAQLAAMVSGPRDAWRIVEPVLACFAARQFWVGDGDEARFLKLAVNVILGGTSALLAEALAIGRCGGLPVSVLMDVICQSAVGSPLLAYKQAAIVADDFEPSFSIEQMIKDLELIGDVALAAGVPTALSDVVRRRFEAARRQGLGEMDYFVLARGVPPGQAAEPSPALTPAGGRRPAVDPGRPEGPRVSDPPAGRPVPTASRPAASGPAARRSDGQEAEA